MNQTSAVAGSTSTWEVDVRKREQEAVAAFLAADIQAMDELLADSFAVNSPLQQVLSKAQLLELLGAARIRHNIYEYEIKHISRHGDVVVVMGNDRVTNPPDETILHRRFTDGWQLEDVRWRFIARHAHVVSRDASR